MVTSTVLLCIALRTTPQAAMALGALYASGTQGLTRNETKSFEWHLAAAVDGNVDAMFLTGMGGDDWLLCMCHMTSLVYIVRNVCSA